MAQQGPKHLSLIASRHPVNGDFDRKIVTANSSQHTPCQRRIRVVCRDDLGIRQGEVQKQLVELIIILDVGLLLPRGQLVERRLSDINMAPLDEFRHLAVKKREQQCPDMRPINIRIRHNDDAVIAQPADIKVIRTDSGAKRCNERANLIRRQHLVESGLFNVQNFAF